MTWLSQGQRDQQHRGIGHPQVGRPPRGDIGTQVGLSVKPIRGERIKGEHCRKHKCRNNEQVNRGCQVEEREERAGQGEQIGDAD